jgi:hypothetical protein
MVDVETSKVNAKLEPVSLGRSMVKFGNYGTQTILV